MLENLKVILISSFKHQSENAEIVMFGTKEMQPIDNPAPIQRNSPPSGGPVPFI